MDFTDKWEAFDWMYSKQLGRRNLTDEQRTMIIGQLYEARKHTHGNNAKRGSDGKYLSLQNVGTGKRPRGTAEEIGKEQGVSFGFVERAAKFAKGIDALAEVSKEAAEKVLEGNSGATKNEVSELRNATQDEVEQFAESVLTGEIKH